MLGLVPREVLPGKPSRSRNIVEDSFTIGPQTYRTPQNYQVLVTMYTFSLNDPFLGKY